MIHVLSVDTYKPAMKEHQTSDLSKNLHLPVISWNRYVLFFTFKNRVSEGQPTSRHLKQIQGKGLVLTIVVLQSVVKAKLLFVFKECFNIRRVICRI